MHFIGFSSLVILGSGRRNSYELLLVTLSINYKSEIAPGGTFIECPAFSNTYRKLQLKHLMFKHFFLATILVLTNIFLFGQVSSEDYIVYSAIIRTEIPDTIKSVAIIKSGIDSRETAENTYMTADNLTSKNLSYKYQTYNWTENYKKERPSIIDSNSAQLLIDYCKSSAGKFTLTNDFNQTYKTILIKKIPVRRKSFQQDCKTFYKRYPDSGGIFSFSKIKYYTEDNTTAIAYYWVRRNGLNGHGAIVVMTKINEEWQMKYKTYLWWN